MKKLTLSKRRRTTTHKASSSGPMMQALEGRRLLTAAISLQMDQFVADEHELIGYGSTVGSPMFATVNLTDIAQDPNLLTATIDWHDGTTTPGYLWLHDNGGGPFMEVEIGGSKVMGNPGTYPFSVTVSEKSDPTVTASGDGTYLVEDYPIRVHGKALVPNSGKNGIQNQVMAAFEDGWVLNQSAADTWTDATGSPSNFTASIDWGDGTKGTGQIVADTATKGLYYVIAGHNYPVQFLKPMTYKIGVTVKDKLGDGQGTDYSYVTIQPTYLPNPIYPPAAIVKPTFLSTPSPLRTEASLLG